MFFQCPFVPMIWAARGILLVDANSELVFYDPQSGNTVLDKRRVGKYFLCYG